MNLHYYACHKYCKQLQLCLLTFNNVEGNEIFFLILTSTDSVATIFSSFITRRIVSRK